MCFSTFDFVKHICLLVQFWNCERGQGFDVDYFHNARIKPFQLDDEYGYTYDIELYGRLGLHCYNLQKVV